MVPEPTNAYKCLCVSYTILYYTLLYYTILYYTMLYYTRAIQKVSSVCEYCRCSAAATMVRVCAEFFDSLSSHGRNLQTFEQCLHIVLCVYNV